MKYKKGLIFLCLIICLFMIASVSATDGDDTAIQAGNETINEVIASEEIENQDSTGVVTSNEENDPDEMGMSEENNLSVRSHSFKELQDIINDAQEHEEINLTNDYSLAYGGTTLDISKSITLNGNGHTLDGGNLNRIMNINVNNAVITLKNLKFKNGGKDNLIMGHIDIKGGAILNEHIGTRLDIVNCDFRHNSVLKYGGAIYSDGPLNITDSTFQKNIAQFGNGGAIHCNSTMFINNTEFIGNEVQENINPLGGLDNIYIVLTDGYYFYGEHLINSAGFARFMQKISSIFEDPVYGNGLPMTGGAIYCKNDCTVHNSNFMRNIVGTTTNEIATSGGAIHCRGSLIVNTTTFDENEVNDWGGGAIFAEKDCTVYDSIFEDNTANKGCAIYCWGETNIYNSEFSHNKHKEGTTWFENKNIVNNILSLISAFLGEIDIPFSFSFFSSDGGAIWSQGQCYIESCEFDGNEVCEQGGAIYAKNDLTMAGENICHTNRVFGKRYGAFEKDGGVIYCKGNLDIDNTYFYNNMAFFHGGAVYCEKKTTISNSRFDENSASLKGGAIYTEKNTITLVNCSFTGNSAGTSGGVAYGEIDISVRNCTFTDNNALEDGGAIYSKGKSIISDSTFNYNSVKGTLNAYKSYGGAIRSQSLSLTNSNFDKNGAEHYGGAISVKDEITATRCRFTNNSAKIDGGAIYCDGKTTLTNCEFISNAASGKKTGFRSFGGAVRSIKLITVNTCYFENNTAYNWGGAIYADGEIRLLNHNEFTGNKAKSAGAIYASTLTKEVSTATSFTNNKATDGDGGAIYINNRCSPTFISCSFRQNTCTGKGGAICLAGYTGTLKLSSCIFEDNSAGDAGGAVYTSYSGSQHTQMDISNSKFKRNFAKSGGAVYTSEIIQVSGSEFLKNKATNGAGGAVFIFNKCDPKFASCIFEENTCTKDGGAIYVDSKNANLKLSDSTFNSNHANANGGAVYVNCNAVEFSTTEIKNSKFTNNYAKEGGAVYTGGIKNTVSNSAFLKNKANNGDGGAIYINNRGPIEFISCRFEGNNAYDRGGAIYIDSNYVTTKFKATYCTFVDNKAENKKYKGKRGGGNIVFNSGKYESINMCWFGINNPTFKWEFLKWKDAISLDTGYTEIGYVNIAMTIDGTELYTNTSYQVKIHFDKTLSKNLFHSTASFYGDGEFSNVKADLNDMTANVCFKTNANHEIYGRLDHQIVKLARTTENKLPSEVHITSCENVTYGHPVKVTFTTVNGSLKDITYEVKNSEGTVVKHGKVYPYSYLSIELGPGTYTVTIINPETSQYLGSSDNATFTVSRGNLYLDLDIPDEIYPETVECSIEGNNRGDCNCNLTIVGDNGPVYSQIITVHSADYYGGANHYNIGVLLPRIYEATLSYPGDNNYEPFTTSKRFTVSTTGTSFEIEITPGEIEYGSNATVMHVISPDATGSIRYYLKNGTFLGEKPVGENFILPLLDAGSYVIMANYTGDAGHNSTSDIAKVVVRKTNPEFGIRIIPVGYGDNATVTHTLPDAATGTIIYYLENGTFLGELSVNENLTLPAWEVKTCLIIANYSGNRNFLNATANATLVINILKTEIIAEPVITTYKDDDYLVILLKDENGNKMAYFNVTVDLKGEENYMTDENGQIKISTADLGADTYDVHILFRGTPNYMNSSNATQIFVNIRPSIMTTTPLVTIYQVHKYLVVNLKDDAGNPISNMDTFITINGVTYPCKTDSAGDAKLIIRLDPKEYIATAVFDNANYTMSLEFTKVTVHKATPKMTAKSKKFKTSKKVKKYTVTLKDNVGKAIKNVKIILKVKGKKYTVRTNPKGKATFKIKNLKKKGKYKATVTYAGNFRFNKVTKKVTITCTK